MVFVDDLRHYGRTRNWPYDEACHMFADTQHELHAMADKLGLKRVWFQNKRSLPHYDLTRNKRRLAIKYGAREADPQLVMRYMRRNRE